MATGVLAPATIRRNPSTSISALFAALAIITPFVNELRDATDPFGVPPSVWVAVTAILGAAAVLGQVWQRAKGSVPTRWEPEDIAIFVLALAAYIAPVLGDLAGALDPLGVPQAVWVLAGAGLNVVGLLGRVWKAVEAGGAPRLEAVTR